VEEAKGGEEGLNDVEVEEGEDRSTRQGRRRKGGFGRGGYREIGC
jgi:hypothetical protein